MRRSIISEEDKEIILAWKECGLFNGSTPWVIFTMLGVIGVLLMGSLDGAEGLFDGAETTDLFRLSPPPVQTPSC